jgi:hypothetical protein
VHLHPHLEVQPFIDIIGGILEHLHLLENLGQTHRHAGAHLQTQHSGGSGTSLVPKPATQRPCLPHKIKEVIPKLTQ